MGIMHGNTQPKWPETKIQPRNRLLSGPKTAPAGSKIKKKETKSKPKESASNNGGKEDHRTPSQIEEDQILERFSAARRRKGVWYCEHPWQVVCHIRVHNQVE